MALTWMLYLAVTIGNPYINPPGCREDTIGGLRHGRMGIQIESIDPFIFVANYLYSLDIHWDWNLSAQHPIVSKENVFLIF